MKLKKILCVMLLLAVVFSFTACAKEFTVAFDLAGGSGEIAAQTVKNKKLAEEPAAPTKADYTFDGWYNGNAKWDFSTPVTGDTTLVAKWTPVEYTITYEVNGGTNASSNPAKYTVETRPASLAAPTAPADYYAFGGWYTDAACTNEVALATITGNITVYAKWTLVDYTISYVDDADAAITGLEPLKYNHSTNAVVLPAGPAKTGYNFIGWHNGTEVITEIAAGTKGNLTLKATYEVITVDVTYELNGGENHADNAASFTPAESVPALNTPANREGYLFGGWYTTADFSGDAVTSLEGIYEDITLYAKWTPVNNEGGTLTPEVPV